MKKDKNKSIPYKDRNYTLAVSNQLFENFYNELSKDSKLNIKDLVILEGAESEIIRKQVLCLCQLFASIKAGSNKENSLYSPFFAEMKDKYLDKLPKE